MSGVKAHQTPVQLEARVAGTVEVLVEVPQAVLEETEEAELLTFVLADQPLEIESL